MRHRHWLVAGTMFMVTATAFAIAFGPLSGPLENHVAQWQHALAKYIAQPGQLAGWRLYAFAFVGGFAASLSPCILGMLPANLSYIGAAKLASRRAAVITAASFVLGVIVVNSAFGLLSSFFFAMLIQYRAAVSIAVGLLYILMGLWMAGIVRFPVTNIVTRMPASAGPFLVGFLFALIASPCASPVLITVLGVVSQSGNVFWAVGAMAVYSVGYTSVLFTASLVTAIATASRKLLAYGELITRFSAAVLFIIGVATIWYGVGIA